MASKQTRNWLMIVASIVAATAVWLVLIVADLDEVFGLRGLDWMWVPPLFGLALGLLGWARGVVLSSAISMALLIGVGWFPPLGRLAQGWVRNDPLPQQRPDAVIVLSAAVTSDGWLSPAAVDRLLAGIGLLDSVAAPRLVVSRVWTDIDTRRPVMSDADQRALVELVNRRVELFRVDSVGSTRVEAERIKVLFDRRGWKSAIVVTSPVHTRRACATFEAIGIGVVCRASPDRRTSIRRQQSPTDRIGAFGQWTYEALGWWKYRIRGWVHAKPA